MCWDSIYRYAIYVGSIETEGYWIFHELSGLQLDSNECRLLDFGARGSNRAGGAGAAGAAGEGGAALVF